MFGDLTFDIRKKLATETSVRSRWITLSIHNFSALQPRAPALYGFVIDPSIVGHLLEHTRAKSLAGTVCCGLP